MPIPDIIELDLGGLKAADNRDRLAAIERLLRQILFSTEVTPSADEAHEWPMDFMWELAPGAKVSLRKVVNETHRERVARLGQRHDAAGKAA